MNTMAAASACFVLCPGMGTVRCVDGTQRRRAKLTSIILGISSTTNVIEFTSVVELNLRGQAPAQLMTCVSEHREKLGWQYDNPSIILLTRDYNFWRASLSCKPHGVYVVHIGGLLTRKSDYQWLPEFQKVTLFQLIAEHAADIAAHPRDIGPPDTWMPPPVVVRPAASKPKSRKTWLRHPPRPRWVQGQFFPPVQHYVK